MTATPLTPLQKEVLEATFLHLHQHLDAAQRYVGLGNTERAAHHVATSAVMARRLGEGWIGMM